MKLKYWSIAGICLAAAVLLPGAEWKFGGKSPNYIVTAESGRSEPGIVSIGRSTSPAWKWDKAKGVAFDKDQSGNLNTRKIAGGRAEFELAFKFDAPLKKFRFLSPELSGVSFKDGGCRFEYRWEGMKEFAPLLVFDEKTTGYTLGGSLKPAFSPWIEIPENQRVDALTLRIVLEGYVGKMSWSGDSAAGGVLEYFVRLDDAARADVKLYPDRAGEGFLYLACMPPVFSADAAGIDAVRVSDLGRGTPAKPARLTRLGQRLMVELPDFTPGLYRVAFEKGGKEILSRTVGLLAPPRPLTFAEMRRSPFGIVGITRRDGFRGSAKLDGPAIGRLLGVHQDRTGGESWVTACNDGRGIFRFASAGERAEQIIAQGIRRRGNLAWTPKWAVDPARIQGKEWFGHYPPRAEYLPDYAAFCRKVAEHYNGVLDPEYEIWNEPNNEPYGSFKGNFDEFVTLCRTAAEAVHSVQPEARMILGTTGDADVGYIGRLLRAGLSKHFALVDIHPYRHTCQGPEDGLLGDIHRLKRVIERDGGKQGIVFSEVGWPTTRIDRPSYQKVTELEQACFNSRTLLISLAAGVERVHFHMFEDWGGDPDNPEHHFGFFRIDGTPKAAAVALSGTARHLEKAEFLGRMKTPEYVHAWQWNTPWRSGARLVTVWQDAQRLREPQQVKITGELLEAADLWGGVPGPERVRAENGTVTVTAGPDPLFLYVKQPAAPKLLPLPPDLRPNLIKRALARRGSAKDIDFANLAEPMIPAEESKAMGAAGIGMDGKPEADNAGQNRAPSRFECRYDETGFTLAVAVAAGRPMKNDRRGWWVWAGDSVRLYIGNSPEKDMDRNHYQICLAPTTAEGKPAAVLISYDAACGLPAGGTLPADIAAADTPEGWKLTAMIPWSVFGRTPKTGEVWHFDLSAPGSMWNNRRDDKWNNPGSWGEIEFL